MCRLVNQVVDQVEATAFHRDHHGKWLKLWWLKSMPFRSLVILLSLLVVTVIFERYSTVSTHHSHDMLWNLHFILIKYSQDIGPRASTIMLLQW